MSKTPIFLISFILSATATQINIDISSPYYHNEIAFKSISDTIILSNSIMLFPMETYSCPCCMPDRWNGVLIVKAYPNSTSKLSIGLDSSKIEARGFIPDSLHFTKYIHLCRETNGITRKTISSDTIFDKISTLPNNLSNADSHIIYDSSVVVNSYSAIYAFTCERGEGGSANEPKDCNSSMINRTINYVSLTKSDTTVLNLKLQLKEVTFQADKPLSPFKQDTLNSLSCLISVDSSGNGVFNIPSGTLKPKSNNNSNYSRVFVKHSTLLNNGPSKKYAAYYNFKGQKMHTHPLSKKNTIGQGIFILHTPINKMDY